MMAQANRIYNLMITAKKLFSLEEIENMFSMFLSSYGNTHGSLGEFQKAVGINLFQ